MSILLTSSIAVYSTHLSALTWKGRPPGLFSSHFHLFHILLVTVLAYYTIHRLTPGSRLSIVRLMIIFYCHRLQVYWFFSGHLFFLFLIFSFSYLSYFHIFVTTLSQSHSTFHIIHATRFITSPLNCYNAIQLQSTRRLCRCSMTCGKEITTVQ